MTSAEITLLEYAKEEHSLRKESVIKLMQPCKEEKMFDFTRSFT